VTATVHTPAGSLIEPRLTFRAVVDEHVRPYAEEFDARGRLPRRLLDLVAEQGWWGASITDGGGMGMDWVSFGRLHEEVGRGCSSLRSLMTVHAMVCAAIERWGRDAHRAWLPALARGDCLGAFCLTEPAAGSDATAIEATAEPRADRFVLNGTKIWVTGGQTAGLYLVFAQHGGGLSSFLVPREATGLTVTPIEGALGTRASMLARIELRDCEVEAHALLGPPEMALPTVMTAALDIGRFSVACGSIGIVCACLEASARHATERAPGGRRLADQQLIRRMLSDMVLDVRAGRLLCEEAGKLKDLRDPATLMATWVAKYHASRAAARAASDTVQIHGAAGCAAGHAAGRLYRDAKVMEIIEGPTELQQTVIADDAFRL
jgi:methoxymalonate biosynthesis protein